MQKTHSFVTKRIAIKDIFILFFLIIMPIESIAGIFEKPLFVRLKDVPLESNPISGYMQFGTFPDGSPAVTKVDETIIRFLSRSEFLKINVSFTQYSVMELNCKTGHIENVGFGSLEKQTAFDTAVGGHNVRKEHPKNIPVYREACRYIGLTPGW